MPKVKTVEMFNKPSFAKINFVKSTEQVKSPRKTSVDKNRQNTPSPRGNKRNWNQQMSQKLGSNFEMFNKACHVCGSFDHLKNDCNNWYNNGRFAKPVWTNVNTIKGTRVNIARPKAVISAVKGNKENAVKASASWKDLKNKGVIDSGCSRNMTRNRSYLFVYKEIDGGFVAFEGNSKGGKITGKESRPNWLFDIDVLTNSINYKPVVAGNQSNGNAGTKACNDAGKARMETTPSKDYILLLMWPADPLFSQDLKSSLDAGFKPSREEEKKDVEDLGNESGNPTEGKDSEVPSIEEPRINQEKDDNINNTNNINTASDGNNTNNVNAISSTVVGSKVNVVDPKTSIELPNDPNMPESDDIVYSDDDEDVGAEADMNNLDAFMPVIPIPTTKKYTLIIPVTNH
ncbi:hypothetical protein Tco_0979037 [Tanacetum coccineum]|uniref:Uncharacterized protein n=1 Tax=Tanacetum coccineum TaxID=301880 RepID=A0ABQ5EPR2_9ASTR